MPQVHSPTTLFRVTFLAVLPAVLLLGRAVDGGLVHPQQEDEAEVTPSDRKPGFGIRESLDTERTIRTDCQVTISGTLRTPVTGDAQADWKLESRGSFEFEERRLTGTGSDAEALRSIRLYRSAQSVTTVADKETILRLANSNRRVIADGRREGLLHYGLGSSLTRREVDLLAIPGDPICVAELLPKDDVGVGEEWNPDRWVLQMMTGLEAVAEQSLTCTLTSCNETEAVVTFDGTIDGAVLGSAAKITVRGNLTFDRKLQFVSSMNLTQSEIRSAGAISPGLNVKVTSQWKRTVSETPDTLSSEDIAAIAGIAEPDTLSLTYSTPWRLEFRHPREWHLFHQTPSVAMLRLVRNGKLVAQCNVSPVISVGPGESTSLEQFVEDVTEAVSARKGAVREAATLDSIPQWKVHRVAASAAAGETTINWVYYLCAAGSGDQFSVSFSFAEEDREQFESGDTAILQSLRLQRRSVALP